MKRHWIITGKYYPQVDVPMDMTHAVAHVPYSYVYLCPVCGDTWARSGVTDVPRGMHSRWHCIQRACQKHAEGLEIPGSVWLSWEPEYNGSFPPELLREELRLHLSYWSYLHEAPICIP